MFEKIVQQNKRITTINSEEIVRVIFSESYSNYFIRNDGEEFAYASDSEFTDFDLLEDGVVSIPKNGVVCVFGSLISTDKDIFVKGNVTIAATNSDVCPFKIAKDGEDKAVLGSIPEIVNNGSVIAKDYQLDGITDFVVNVPDRCEIAGIGTVTQNGMIKAADFELDGISELDVQVPDPHTFGEKVISENGVYNSSDDNISGFSKVTVDVPDPHTFSEKVISENGVYNSSDDNISGFSKVTVEVPDPHTFSEKVISENGIYNSSDDNISGFSKVTVDVPDTHTFGTKTITKNGTYNSSDSGVSGFSSVSVNIPLTSKTITSNGLYVNPEGGWKNVQVDVPDPHKFGNLTATANKTYYAADSGLSGFSNVSVQVPDPHTFGSKRITSNGTYNSEEDDGVSGYSNVSVEIPLGTKTITENGVYNSVDYGVSGFSSVDVNVPDLHTFSEKVITENGVYNSSDDVVSGFSKVTVEVPDNHTFGTKSIFSSGTFNSSSDGFSGFSSVSVYCECKGKYRTYIYDECRLVGVNYAYYGANSSGLTEKNYLSNKKCPSSIVLDQSKRDYWYFSPTVSDNSNLEKVGKTYKGLGLSVVFVPGYSSKMRVSCGPSESNVEYSNIIDLNNYKVANNPSELLYDIVIPFDAIFNNGSTGNVWNTSYRFLKFEAVDGSIITFNRVWFNTTSTLSCTNPTS